MALNMSMSDFDLLVSSTGSANLASMLNQLAAFNLEMGTNFKKSDVQNAFAAYITADADVIEAENVEAGVKAKKAAKKGKKVVAPVILETVVEEKKELDTFIETINSMPEFADMSDAGYDVADRIEALANDEELIADEAVALSSVPAKIAAIVAAETPAPVVIKLDMTQVERVMALVAKYEKSEFLFAEAVEANKRVTELKIQRESHISNADTYAEKVLAMNQELKNLKESCFQDMVKANSDLAGFNTSLLKKDLPFTLRTMLEAARKGIENQMKMFYSDIPDLEKRIEAGRDIIRAHEASSDKAKDAIVAAAKERSDKLEQANAILTELGVAHKGFDKNGQIMEIQNVKPISAPAPVKPQPIAAPAPVKNNPVPTNKFGNVDLGNGVTFTPAK